jgi:hypothetical protein
MKLKQLLSLLCLFAVVALFSSSVSAAPAAAVAPAPSMTMSPVQSPAAPAADLTGLFTPAMSTTGVPEWGPMLGCTLTFCNICTQDGGICRWTGTHCFCV